MHIIYKVNVARNEYICAVDNEYISACDSYCFFFSIVTYNLILPTVSITLKNVTLDFRNSTTRQDNEIAPSILSLVVSLYFS